MSFIWMRRMSLWYTLMKGKEITMWIHLYLNWQTNFNSKNGRNKSFSYETKASMSLIPIKRMRLWHPIMKWKEIFMWIHVYPNWQMNFNCKSGRKRSFFYETKPSMSFITMSITSLWYPIMRRKVFIMWICVCPNWQINLILKNSWKKSFSYETKA